MIESRARAARTLIFFVAVGLAIATIATAGTVVAQTNETIDDSDNETTYLGAIDSDTRIVAAEMVERDVMEITIESDRDQEMAITDASQEIDGFVEINQRVLEVPEGTTEIEFRIANPSQPAVTVQTHNGFVGVGEQDFEGDRPSVQWDTVQMLIGITAVGSVGITYRLLKKRREDSKPEVDRIL